MNVEALRRAILSVNPAVRFVGKEEMHARVEWARGTLVVRHDVDRDDVADIVKKVARRIVEIVRFFGLIFDLEIVRRDDQSPPKVIYHVRYSAPRLEFDAERTRELRKHCVLPASVLDTDDLETLRRKVRLSRGLLIELIEDSERYTEYLLEHGEERHLKRLRGENDDDEE